MIFEDNEQSKLIFMLMELQSDLRSCDSYEEMDQLMNDFAYDYPFILESKEALQEIENMDIPGISTIASKYLMNWNLIQKWRQ